MTVHGEAPAIEIGDLFWTWLKYGGNPRTMDKAEDLSQGLLDLPKPSPAKVHGGNDLYAGMPEVSVDWSDRDGGGGNRDDNDRGHHAPSESTQGHGGLATALSLFKAFGHSDLDI